MGDITTAFVKQFQGNIEMLVQQKGSRLRDTVRIKAGVVGEDVYVDQISSTAAVKRTTRHADTPLIDTVYSRRRITMYDYEWADLIDKEDKLKMLADPTSEYSQNGAYALGRAIDDAIIAAADGTAYTGKDGSTSTAMLTANIIAHASSGLTIAKLLSAKELLDAAEVDADEPRYCIVTAAQVTDLLNTTEVKSADYNTVRALAEGKLDTFLGFKFLRTERLLEDATPDRKVLCYVQSGICLALGKDITASIDKRVDKSNATQVYLSMSIGASRMEEKKVVTIACEE